MASGVRIMGWDWDAVEHTSASGTTYGSYVLVGTFDGETFVLTEPAVVELHVATSERQRELDERFGEGVARQQECS